MINQSEEWSWWRAKDASAHRYSKPLRVFLVAGEASGDQHAAALLRTLRERVDSVSVFGMAGSASAAEGMELIVDAEKQASVMGFTELGGQLRNLWRAYRTLLHEVDKRKPDIAVLLDFPDFNMRIARALHRRGVRVLYFIAPQIWAWRQGRVRSIKRYVDKIAAIFPFEEAFYRLHGVEAEYVGHPFLDRPELVLNREDFFKQHSLELNQPLLALLPGSRNAEVERLLPPMLESVERLRVIRPGLQFAIPVAPTLSFHKMQQLVEGASGVRLLRGSARELLHLADAAVVASGTATMEAALARVPFVVVYQLSPLSYAIAKRLIKGVSHIAMANLIAGEAIVPELIQDQASADNIVREVERILGDDKYRESVRVKLEAVRRRLLRRGDAASSCDNVVSLMLDLVEGHAR